MFYSQFILAKKGPLGTIWIAAHLERKLRKNQVADTDIGFSVDSILFPEMPIALRLSSHLLLGVVRIYSRKVNYLFDDCSEALLKVKQAFRSTAVDLPPEESTAPYHSITLPETFDLDDFELPDSEIFQGNYVDHHISSKEQITLQDTMEGVVYSTSNFGLDERFGDGDACGLDLDEELLVDRPPTAEHTTGTSNSDVDPQASDHVNALFKYDHNQDTPTIPEAMPAGGVMDQIDEYDGDNEPVEYAHAPCTPGLWEEPNLSNIQETSAYDDHQEPENHIIPEFNVKDNLENISSKEPEYLPHEQHHNQFEPLEKSPPHIVTPTEQMSMNDLVSTPYIEPVSVDQVGSMPPIIEVPETVVSVVDDPVKVMELLNKNVSYQEPEVLHSNHENYVQHQVISNNITHVVNQENNTFHHTNELELNSEPTGEDNQAFMQHKDSTIPAQSNNDNMPSFDFMGLRPCVTLSNHDPNSVPPSGFTPMQEHPIAYGVPDLSQGEVQVTEPLERNIPETYLPEPGPSDVVHVAPSIPNRQVDNVIEQEAQVYNTNSYNTPNFPAPEKVLSFSQGHSDVPKESVPESTPAEVVPPRAFPSTVSNRQVENVNEREFQVNNSNSYTPNFPAPEQLLSFSQLPPKNMVVPESTPVIAPGYEGDTGNNMYSGRGRKRSITESQMTTQSLNFNLNESSSFYTTTNTSRESIRDDDLLSSILVGRNSSILKMKPTPTPTPAPPTEAPSTKRRRQSAPKTAPKTTTSKRKVLMDDNMVLHGDTIRQQLTNTEDIRRLRKKAPCTHSEISMIEKQFWEDNLFGQPIFTGMSNKLTSLQRQLYDISKIVVSQYDDASLEGVTDQKSISHNDEKDLQQPEMVTENTPDVPKENRDHENFDPVPIKDVSEEQPDVENRDQDKFDHVAMKDVSETQPIEVPLVTVTDNHTCDNKTTDLDYYDNQPQMQMHTTGDFTELFGPEHDVLDHGTAMEIDEKSFQDSDNGVSVIPIEAESPKHAEVVPSDTNDMSAGLNEVEKTIQMDASLLTGPPPGFDSNEKIDLPSVDMDASLRSGPPPGFGSNEKMEFQSADMDASLQTGPPPGFGSNEKMDLQSADVDRSVGKSIESEIKVDDASVRETSEEKQEPVTFDGLKSQIGTTLDQDIEFKRNEEVVVNEDAAYAPNVDCNAQNQVSNGIFGEEEFVAVEPYDSEVNRVLEDALLDERERTRHHFTNPMTTLNLEDIPVDNRVDVDDDDDDVNDTDFLNFDDVDDDEAGDAADDYAPDGDGEATKLLDNSGWSSRTRAVAKYLQIMFDKEGERGRNMLAVNNLLAGKTRKEASRMFFETLVLKTKDYIHVEQTDPFENINVFPRSKLLKSEF